MHNNENKRIFLAFLRFLIDFLPMIFWILLIFGFDEAHIACLTILSAVIHEAGHEIFVFIKEGAPQTVRGVISGFRIGKNIHLSYGEEMLLYASGPLANIGAAIIGAFFIPAIGEYAALFSVINAATAISNLLPVEGYDGYGILRCMIERKWPCAPFDKLLGAVSFGIIFMMCLLSLYMIDRCGGGYWVFAVFFISMLSKLAKALKKVKNDI